MAIPMSNYASVTSAVGGTSPAATRSLGGLIITNNTLVPTGTFLNFTSAAAVGTYFGTGSEEYLRAVFYFGWISKLGTQAQVLSFWFWNNDAATGSLIYGVQGTYTLSTFTAISSGELSLTLGGFTHTLTGINLGSAGSLTAVATDITTAINAYSSGGSAWTAAVVTWDSTTSQFNLVSGTTGADVVSVTAAGSNDLGGPLGWLTGAIYSNGTAAQTLSANLNQLITIDNNFGSFCLANEFNTTLANVEAAANWNNSLTPNIQFMYSAPVTAANAASWNTALIGIGGVTLTLQYPGGSDPTGAYHEMMPMMILAATNYTARNSVQNYEFQIFNATATVTTQANYALYTGLRINFYGQTQTAGSTLNFYQQGVMMGLPVNPSDQNVYANEIWLANALQTALMNLLLSLAQLPADAQGQAQALAVLQSIINQALLNGTISVGKTLDIDQQLYITNATGNPQAWQQVQNVGYWVGTSIQPYVVDGATEYKLVYTLIYSKDDVIRLIQGTDILI
jgi:Protein of unknown function (DUF3383)